MKNQINIALVGNFDATIAAHLAIPRALELNAQPLGCTVQAIWHPTETLIKDAPENLRAAQGIWSIPGSPYRSTVGMLNAISYARENQVPFLGTCGGFQHALLEYFRNVLGMTEADHAELDPETKTPVLALLHCSLVEEDRVVHFEPNSMLRAIYKEQSFRETYHCRYGLNPEFVELLAGKPLGIAARDDRGDVRAVELRDHPFFIGTLYQPERAALEGKGHPLVSAFLRAAREL